MIVSLDFQSDVPIYLQLRNQIVIGISNGTLAPGEKLPTIRALAQEIGINTMTVNKAYQLLKQEGYICADRRSGAIVNDTYQKKRSLSKKTSDALKVVISEAKLEGFTESEFLTICRELYSGKS
ncbi:GntR family transcriptional regulator [Clostridium sp. Marseille-P2415]|uniref:GntR family transcriptional regulator n=1 Tax=Clostridium sp. Marseille-P2415 TaxID=1805471 RepID=UPI0009886219|nr:GntR family transcriptional regulator [Clostridium sp. Marseille-P2415]